MRVAVWQDAKKHIAINKKNVRNKFLIFPPYIAVHLGKHPSMNIILTGNSIFLLTVFTVLTTIVYKKSQEHRCYHHIIL